jgi:hypothetical protein
MTRFALRLPQHQTRLVALAVSYHLSRPGSELDPETLAEYQHGLANVRQVVDGQVDAASASIELTALQATLLSTAMSSVISELKTYSLVDTMSGSSQRPRSVAAGFDGRLRDLFPAVASDPAHTQALAEDLMMLRRELPLKRAKELLGEQRAVVEAEAKSRKSWWQFWRRQGDY